MDPSVRAGLPRVLIVEDDPSLRRLLEIRLSVDGYETRAARDGAAALEELAIWTPDAVLTDLMMPRLSGLDLCRAIRGDACTAAIPIILLTARFLDDEISPVLQLGAITFMSKPFDAKALDDALRAAMAGRSSELSRGLPGVAS